MTESGRAIEEKANFKELVRHAATCRGLSAFRKRLSARN